MKKHLMARGFTLIELLLSVAIFVILSGLVLVAINPLYQLSKGRDAQRKNDVAEVRKAIQQYYIDYREYPVKTSDQTQVYDICNTLDLADTTMVCAYYIKLTSLVPVYTSGVPHDPLIEKTKQYSGYRIAVNRDTGVYVEAPLTEIGVGEKQQVIFVGIPPRGYEIPTVKTLTVSGRGTNLVESYSLAIARSPDWVRNLLIFIGGIVIGYWLRAKQIFKRRHAVAPPH